MSRERRSFSSSFGNDNDYYDDENCNSNDASDAAYETPYFIRVTYNYLPKYEKHGDYIPFSPSDINRHEFIESIKRHRRIADIPLFLASTRGIAILQYLFSYVHPNQYPAEEFFDLLIVFSSNAELWIGTKRRIMERVISVLWNFKTHQNFLNVFRNTFFSKNRISMDSSRCASIAWFLIHYYHADPANHHYVQEIIPFLYGNLQKDGESYQTLLEQLCNTFYFVNMVPSTTDTDYNGNKNGADDYRRMVLFPETHQITVNYNRSSLYQGYQGNPCAARSKLLHQHFHLLQEDMIAPLSEELQRLLTHPYRQQIFHEYAFEEAFSTGLKLQDYGPLSTTIIVTMKCSNALYKKVKNMRKSVRTIYSEDPDRLFLTPESILLFIQDDELLAMGMIADKKISFSEDCRFVSVGLKFFGHALEYALARLTGSNIHRTNSRSNIEQSSPGIIGKRLGQHVIQAKTSFFGHLPFLERLQRMIGAEDMSFDHEIVHPSPIVQNSIFGSNGIPMPKAVADSLQSDHNQYLAASHALSKKLTIIQGPPGTGKTFVGVKIVKSILQKAQNHRILVMCYTNHALDSFLESILKEKDDKHGLPVVKPKSIVRFGSRLKTSDCILSQCYASLNSTSTPLLEDEVRLWRDLENEKNQLELIINEYSNQITDSKMFGDSKESYHRLMKHCREQQETGEDDCEYSSIIHQLTVPCTCAGSTYFSEETYGSPQRSPRRTPGKSPKKRSNPHCASCSLNKLEIHDYWTMWCNGRTQPYDINISNEDQELMNTEDDASTQENLWKLTLEQRYEKLHYWYFTFIQGMTKELAKAIEKRDQLVSLMNDISKTSCNNFADLRIIACTTTFAARNSQFLNDMQVSIGVIEEAAEILEAQLIATIPSTVKQLVMIGDHQQLKPKLQYYPLRSESYQGINFDQSLFERLVTSGQYPKISLAIQHRMRPEISSFVRTLTYPYLMDSEKTLQRENIKGIKTNVIFINHEYLEVNELTASTSGNGDGNSSGIDGEDMGTSNHGDSTHHYELYHQSSIALSSSKSTRQRRPQLYDTFTKSNPYEADMSIAIFQYLLQQGYKAEDITILTPYLGQLQLLQQVIESNGQYISELNDLDRNELRENHVNNNDDRSSVISNGTDEEDKIKIRIATIDNFQGEEAKIIIASLVRSNINGEIGFLSRPERINVLLSRARDGFILIGNGKTFIMKGQQIRQQRQQLQHVEHSQDEIHKDGYEHWYLFLEELERRKCIFNGFPTVCTTHQKEQLITTAKEFSDLVPHGGCRDVCGEIIGTCPFKHSCQKYCHPIPRTAMQSNSSSISNNCCSDSLSFHYHQQMKCMVPVTMKCPRQLHTVVKYCHSRLREPCKAVVDVTCSRGHQFQTKCCVFDVDKACIDCAEGAPAMIDHQNNELTTRRESRRNNKRHFDDVMDCSKDGDDARENEKGVEMRTPSHNKLRSKRSRFHDEDEFKSPQRSAHREVQVITGKNLKAPPPTNGRNSAIRTGREVEFGGHQLREGNSSLLSPFAFREEIRSSFNSSKVEDTSKVNQTPSRKKLLFDDDGEPIPYSSSTAVTVLSSPSRSLSRDVIITSPVPKALNLSSSTKAQDYDRNFTLQALPSYNRFLALPIPQTLKDTVLTFILQRKQSTTNNINGHQKLLLRFTSANALVYEEVTFVIHQLLIESSLVTNNIEQVGRIKDEKSLRSWVFAHSMNDYHSNGRQLIIIDLLKASNSMALKVITSTQLRELSENHVLILFDKMSGTETSSEFDTPPSLESFQLFSFMTAPSLRILVHILKKELHLVDPTLFFTDEVVHAIAYRLYIDHEVITTRSKLRDLFLSKMIESVEKYRSNAKKKRETASTSTSAATWLPTATSATANNKVLNEIQLDLVPSLSNSANRIAENDLFASKLVKSLQTMYSIPQQVILNMLPLIAQQLQSVSNFNEETDLIAFRNLVEMSIGVRLVNYCSNNSNQSTAQSSIIAPAVVVVVKEGKYCVQLKVDDINLALSKFIMKKLSPESMADNHVIYSVELENEDVMNMDDIEGDDDTDTVPQMFHIGSSRPSIGTKTGNSRKDTNRKTSARITTTSSSTATVPASVTYQDWMNIHPTFIHFFHSLLVDMRMGTKKIKQIGNVSLDHPTIQYIIRRFEGSKALGGARLSGEDLDNCLLQWQALQTQVALAMKEQSKIHRSIDIGSRWRCCVCAGSAYECNICLYTSPNWF